MGKLTHRRRPNYATLSPNPPVEAQVSPRGNEGAPGDRFPNCRQEHPKARSEPIHDNTRTSVLSTGGEEESGITAAAGGADDDAAAGGREASVPSAQWAEEAPLATRRDELRAGALAARAPAAPLLLRVNETFRWAGARRDWERLGAGTGTGTGGGGRGRAREPTRTRDSDGRGQRIRGRATGGASPRSHPRRAAPVSRRSAPPHTRRPPLARRARSCRFDHAHDRVSRSVCWLPSSATHVNPSRAPCASDERQAAHERMRAKRRATHSGTGATGPTLLEQFWRGVLIWFSQSSTLQQVNVVLSIS